MEITQSYLDELIFTPKRITIKPERNYQVINGSNRKNFELVSDKYNERFRVFIRQNVTLPEIYSIGLQLINNNFEENPILFRCNGPHGGNKSIPEHFVTHIHRAQLISVDIGLFGIEKLNEACGEFQNRLFKDTAFDADTDAALLKVMLAKEGLIGGGMEEDER